MQMHLCSPSHLPFLDEPTVNVDNPVEVFLLVMDVVLWHLNLDHLQIALHSSFSLAIITRHGHDYSHHLVVQKLE